MTCQQPPRPLGQFLVSYVRNFKRDHPEVTIRMPYEHTESGLFEVTERGVISTYETGTAMIVDLWDRYPESAFRELSLGELCGLILACRLETGAASAEDK
jgi:hypothetical protein